MAIGKVIKGDASVDASIAADPPKSTVRPARAGVVSSEEFEARSTANEIIENAKRDAEKIREEARAKRDQYIEEGKKEGRDIATAQVTELMAKAKLARDEMLQSAEPEAVKLALKIAEKVIGHDVERDPELLQDVIAQAAEQIRQAQQLVIRVAPRAAKILRQTMPKLCEKIGVTKVCSLKEDPDIEDEIGCVIETPFGTLDAKLSTQMRVLQQVLLPETGKKEVK